MLIVMFEEIQVADDGIDAHSAMEALQSKGGDDGPDNRQALAVRALLRRLRGIAREHTRIEELRSAVIEPYNDALSSLDIMEDRIRTSLTTYLRTTKTGKVQIPDAGTAYLSSRKPKVEIDDEAALLLWWEKDAGREVPMTKPKPDLTAVKAQILAELEETGEVPPDGSGVTIVPAEKHVAVRLS